MLQRHEILTGLTYSAAGLSAVGAAFVIDAAFLRPDISSEMRVEAAGGSAQQLGGVATSDCVGITLNIRGCEQNALEQVTTSTTSSSMTTTTTIERIVPDRASRSAPRATTTNVPPPAPITTASTESGQSTALESWQPAPECMAPMGPTEWKTKEASHHCWDTLLAFYPWDQKIAFAILYCESKGNPHADNPNSTATGLLQILGGPPDPKANIATGYSMFMNRGWQPWESCPWEQYLEP